MSDTARMLYLHALSSLHTGVGQAAGVIDLPIARERVTGWPLVPASSLKGVLRQEMETLADLGTSAKVDSNWVRSAFGPPTEDASASAGGLCFGDQRILCLPVRSFFGTFAYVTCPLALTRLRRDCEAAGLVPPFEALSHAVSGSDAHVVEGSLLARGGRIYLEDLDLTCSTCAEANQVGASVAQQLFDNEEERKPFTLRFAVVSDDVFGFLCETATEVSARVKLKDDEKTVQRGGLWYEESVPAETVFCGPVVVAAHRVAASADLLAPLPDLTLQVGGKASVGRGLCRLRVRS